MKSTSPPAKRRYDSTHRQEQARRTRLEVIQAARKLFFEYGYSGTSIEAIAQEAGVAVETVYAIFGSKRQILSSLVDYSLTGDDLPVPLLKREEIQETLQESDPQRLLERFARGISIIMGRMAPIFALLNETAGTDSEIASRLDKMLEERLGGMALVVDALVRLDALRQDLSPDQAAETIWALSSAEVFHLLTVVRGWERQKYEGWLADTLMRVLLRQD
jgi:TetR/AcrR family transcriptional regulator of autoinduction and epiphytic fitness